MSIWWFVIGMVAFYALVAIGAIAHSRQSEETRKREAAERERQTSPRA